MAVVHLTSQAEKDLNAVIDYYLNVGPVGYIDVLEDELISKMRSLESFPRMGRQVPEIGDPSIREVFVRNYRVVHHVDDRDESVLILTIFHSSKDFG